MNMSFLRVLTISLLFLFSPWLTVHAASPDGQTLHQQFCTSCHGVDQYSPAKRKINDLGALNRRIKGCSRAAGAEWSASELQAVVNFVNQTYYQFKP